MFWVTSGGMSGPENHKVDLFEFVFECWYHSSWRKAGDLVRNTSSAIQIEMANANTCYNLHGLLSLILKKMNNSNWG